MRLTLWTLILSTALSSPCLAQVCEEDALQSSLQYLRRLSIDLKGTLPNLNQLEEVVNTTMVPDALVEDLLNMPQVAEIIAKEKLKNLDKINELSDRIGELELAETDLQLEKNS